MYDKNILTYRLETHETKDILDNHTNGKLTVIWRDWDKIIEYQPKMAYISYVNSGEIILFVFKVKLYLLLKMIMGNIMRSNQEKMILF